MTYPPPTLVKKRSRSAWIRFGVLLLVVAIVLGTCTATRFLSSDKAHEPKVSDLLGENSVDEGSVVEAPVAPSGEADMAQTTNEAVTDVAQAPVAPAAPEPEAAQAPAPTPAQAATSAAGDARQANRWYYVGALGDGPGAIYSRTGGQWDYAFACARPSRTIEFIAVNTGDPGSYDRQTLSVGATSQPMNASYARSGGGTISSKLPARDAFFDKLTDGATLEVQLLANRRVMLPIGPDVVRLIRDCRGR